MTRALVTGGAGFIGSALATGLLERGYDVVVLDNLVTGRAEVVPSGAELIVGDIRHETELEKACDGIEVIFHEAAIRSVPKSVDNPWTSHDSNVNGTLKLLMVAERSSVSKLVYASSSSVYGDVGSGPSVETLPTNPQSPYAASKLAGENYCRVWSRLGRLRIVSLRYFNVFGPGQHPESKYSAVFPAFVSALLAGNRPQVHWDGEQSRDFTYIEDVVDANIRAAETDEVDGVINIASGRPRTVNEVLKTVSGEVGRWIDPEFVAKREGDVRATHADISRARRLIGWEPRVQWDDAVKATVSFFKA